MQDRNTHIINEETENVESMATVMLFLRHSTGKTERYTHFCMPLKPVFTRDCGDGVHFIDEPTNGLDPIGIQDLRKLIRSFSAKGITVILSSHILSEVELIADHIGIISNGKLGYEGEVHKDADLERIFMEAVGSTRGEG